MITVPYTPARLMAALAFSVVLAACGGGGSSDGSSAPGAGIGVQPPTPPASGPTPPASGPTPPVIPPVVIPTNGNAKVSIALEPVGTTCAEGGIGISAGIDDNSNNILDPAEVSKTASSCFLTPRAAGLTSTAGMATLVRLNAEAAGTYCALGGRRLDSGFDANDNGTLELSEIKSTQFLCTTATVTASGSDLLVAIKDEPRAGPGNCQFGGKKLSMGTGTTDTYLCNPIDPGTAPIWARVKSLAQQAAAGFAYIIDSLTTGTVVVTLPTAPAIGDVFRVRGESGNAWKIAQNAGQTIGTRALPGGVEPGTNFEAAANTTQPWWFVASSASGQNLIAVGNVFIDLHPPGAVNNNGSLFLSKDGGVSWTPVVGPPVGAWVSVASSADGTKLAATGFGLGIWTSADSGQKWSQNVLEFYFPTPDDFYNTEFVSISISADGSRVIAATIDTFGGNVGDGRIFTFAQMPGQPFGQGTWTRQESLSSTHSWRGVAISADGSTVVAAAYRDANDMAEGVYVSNDYGANWALGFDPGLQGTSYRVAISADGTRMIMGERFGKIYTSSNRGVSWLERPFEGGFNAVASSADGLTIAAVQAQGFTRTENFGGNRPPLAGRDGKLLVSVDGGSSWVNRSSNARWYRGAAMSADGNRLVAAVDGGQIFVSTSNRTTYGTAGSITGGQTNELTLRYLGDGLFNAIATSGPMYTIN